MIHMQWISVYKNQSIGMTNKTDHYFTTIWIKPCTKSSKSNRFYFRYNIYNNTYGFIIRTLHNGVQTIDYSSPKHEGCLFFRSDDMVLFFCCNNTPFIGMGQLCERGRQHQVNIQNFDSIRKFVWTNWDLFASCSINWEEQTFNALTYILFLFATGLIIPVFVITYSYMNILKTMRTVSQFVVFWLAEFQIVEIFLFLILIENKFYFNRIQISKLD